MKYVTINSRLCPSAFVAGSKDCIVFLHALLMNALEMWNCVGADRLSDAGISVVSAVSSDPINWDYEAGSVDAVWLAQLVATIKQQNPSIQRVHLVGWSNGGEMAGCMALNGDDYFATFWQICATRRTSQIGTSGSIEGTHVLFYMGNTDPLVPIDGNVCSISLAEAETLYESVGADVDVQVFDGGHCYPGGICVSAALGEALGGWCMTTDVTGDIIRYVGGLP